MKKHAQKKTHEQKKKRGGTGRTAILKEQKTDKNEIFNDVRMKKSERELLYWLFT